MARSLDEDPDTQGPKSRSVGGWPMLIHPDGTYEVYDWDSAKRFFWNEEQYCPDPETISDATVTLYTMEEMYWKSTNQSKVLCITLTDSSA